MPITTEDIASSLAGISCDSLKVESTDDPWYSVRTVYRLAGDYHGMMAAEKSSAVRVLLRHGVLEIIPDPANSELAKVRCYCCFGGNPEHGSHRLADLASVIQSLKDHECPPWPG